MWEVFDREIRNRAQNKRPLHNRNTVFLNLSSWSVEHWIVEFCLNRVSA